MGLCFLFEPLAPSVVLRCDHAWFLRLQQQQQPVSVTNMMYRLETEGREMVASAASYAGTVLPGVSRALFLIIFLCVL